MENQTAGTPFPARLTLRICMRQGAQYLNAAGIDEPRLDAEILLRHTLGIERAEFYLRIDEQAETSFDRQYWKLLQRRARREPIAYITGRKEFWSLEFSVSPDVLIPRPETELLVEASLERARSMLNARLNIVDIGTGSGAIAICLAKELPEAEISAVDISTAALQMARANAERHGVESRIRFVAGDLFAPFDKQRFDLIVANPPYIRTGELAQLAPEIREWEPITSLDGGADGLNEYRRLSAHCHDYLTQRGHVLLEVGDGMAPAVARLFADAGRYETAALIRDYAGKDRVVDASKRLLPSTPFPGGFACG